jgi:hypothetical protein
LVGSEKFEAKWSGKEAKINVFFHVSVRNACETDLVSICFALKRKMFFCETEAPYPHMCRLPLPKGICGACPKPPQRGVMHPAQSPGIYVLELYWVQRFSAKKWLLNFRRQFL